MAKSPHPKFVTRQIVLSEPDQAALKDSLQGRQLSPGLARFLHNLVKTFDFTGGKSGSGIATHPLLEKAP